MLDAKFIPKPEFVKTVQNRNGDPAVIDELMAVDARRAAIGQRGVAGFHCNRFRCRFLQQLKKKANGTRWPRPGARAGVLLEFAAEGAARARCFGGGAKG